MSDENKNLTVLAKWWRERAQKCRDEARMPDSLLFTRAEVLDECATELNAYHKHPGKTTDYHQKPIDSMTADEKRAYRRELARAALSGLLPRPTYLNNLTGECNYAYKIADLMIEHERREEGEHDD